MRDITQVHDQTESQYLSSVVDALSPDAYAILQGLLGEGYALKPALDRTFEIIDDNQKHDAPAAPSAV